MTKPGLSVVVFLLLPAAAAVAQERHRLQLRAREGDRFVHRQDQTNEINLTTILGNNRSTRSLHNREVLAVEDEVLEVEGVDPVRVRRTVHEWWKEVRESDAGPARKSVMKLQGRTLLLRRQGADTAYEGAEGIPIEELARHRIRQGPFLNSLPPEPVAVGHEWKVDEERFRREVEGTAAGGPMRFKTVRATGRFVKVEERKGEKCALIEVNVVADGTFTRPAGLKAVYRLKTRIVLGLETGRPHTMDGDGTIALEGTVDQDGQEIRLEGTFKISMKGRNEFK